jgi:hypothetical protein
MPIRTRTPARIAVAASLMFVLCTYGDEPAATRPTSQPAVPAISLGAEMNAMLHDYRLIKKQIKDPSANASTIAALVDMQQHTATAKNAPPVMAPGGFGAPAATQPTADAIAEYQTTLTRLLRDELEMEDLLRAGENEKAAAVIQKMDDRANHAHTRFVPPMAMSPSIE